MELSKLDKAFKLKKQGYSYNDISKELKMDPSHIRKELVRNGYNIETLKSPPRGGKNKKKELYPKALELRQQGYTLIQIADTLGCTYSQLTNWNIGNIENNPNGQSFYTKDFSLIERPNKDTFYFLGLIFSDGHLKNNNRLTLELHQEDKYILKELRNCLVPSAGLTKRKNCYKLEITSKYLGDLLNNFGFYNTSKSKNELSLENIPKHELNNFIRGYFDGDGSVINSNGRCSVKIAGPAGLITEIKEFLNEDLQIALDSRIQRSQSITDSLYFSFSKKEDLLAFYSFLYYNDSNLYLVRKKNKLYNYLYTQNGSPSSESWKQKTP